MIVGVKLIKYEMYLNDLYTHKLNSSKMTDRFSKGNSKLLLKTFSSNRKGNAERDNSAALAGQQCFDEKQFRT